MSRFSPRVLPTNANPFADALRGYIEGRNQKRDDQYRDQLIADRANERRASDQERELRLYGMGFRKGTKPLETSGMSWGQQSPGLESNGSVNRFADGLRDHASSLLRREQPEPITSITPENNWFADGLRNHLEGRPPLPIQTQSTQSANPSNAQPATLKVGAFDPSSGGFTTARPQLQQRQRFEQVNSDWYIDNEATPQASERREQTEQAEFAGAERSRKRMALIEAGIPEQYADVVLDNPGLISEVPNSPFRKPLPPRNIDPLSPEGLKAFAQKEQISSRYGNSGRTSDPNYQILQTDEGVFQVNPKTGETRPLMMPNGSQFQKAVPAAIRTAVAQNRSSISSIDTALRELDNNKDATGFWKGRMDAIDQRVDPEGVAARAAIANIGSLMIHKRSGAAVTASEFPRLRPFIPSASDTEQTVRTKLRMLKEAIEEETQSMESVPGNSAVSSKESISATEAAEMRAAGVAESTIKSRYIIQGE